MKTILRSLCAAIASLTLMALPGFALNKSVTTVGAAASVILTPGQNIHILIITNEGSGSVRLALDGTNAPTASTGFLLQSGQSLIITYTGSKAPPIVRAILTSATTTTLSVVTDDTQST